MSQPLSIKLALELPAVSYSFKIFERLGYICHKECITKEDGVVPAWLEKIIPPDTVRASTIV